MWPVRDSVAYEVITLLGEFLGQGESPAWALAHAQSACIGRHDLATTEGRHFYQSAAAFFECHWRESQQGVNWRAT
jgi:hypothetical protein